MMEKIERALCACGCGHPVTQPGNKWLRGHSKRKRLAAETLPGPDKDIITQDVRIAQQALKQVLSSAGDTHMINVITIGQVRVDNCKGHNGSKPASLSVVLDQFEEPRLDNILQAVREYAAKSDLLSKKSLDAKLMWLAACERALIDYDEEIFFS